MRKTFAIFQASPRRLLSLLLMQIIVALTVPQVAGGSAESKSRIGGTHDIYSIIGSESFIRTYQLFSRCSGSGVEMTKPISAIGLRKSPFTRLDFISDPTGAIKIRSKTRKYLCFSRKGQLISRFDGDTPKCMFREVTTGNFVKLQSVANSEWYVGFNKKGKRLKGYAKKDTWKRELCFMFTKYEWRPKMRHQRHLEQLSKKALGISLRQFNLNNR